MADHPADRQYTANHEWVLRIDDTTVRVGITGYAAEQLGDIVYVALPEVGGEVTAGGACGELESTKSVSDVYSPVNGVVSAVNTAVADDPAGVNTDPFGDGWLFEIRATDEPADLLDADAYGAQVS